jgi:hypothetical protein
MPPELDEAHVELVARAEGFETPPVRQPNESAREKARVRSVPKAVRSAAAGIYGAVDRRSEPLEHLARVVCRSCVETHLQSPGLNQYKVGNKVRSLTRFP